MALRKVVCTICRSIFKVVEDPPPAIVAPGGEDLNGRPLDPYARSELELTDDIEAMDWCQRNCVYCRRDSPWPTGFQSE